MKNYNIINSEIITEGDYRFLIMKDGKDRIRIAVNDTVTLHLAGEIELIRRGLSIAGYGYLGDLHVVFFTNFKPLILTANINWILVGMMADHYYWEGNNGSVYNITDSENVPIGGFSSAGTICYLKGLPENAFLIVKKLDDENRQAD